MTMFIVKENEPRINSTFTISYGNYDVSDDIACGGSIVLPSPTVLPSHSLKDNFNIICCFKDQAGRAKNEKNSSSMFWNYMTRVEEYWDYLAVTKGYEFRITQKTQGASY